MTSPTVVEPPRTPPVPRTAAPAAKLAPPALPRTTIDRPRLSRALSRAVRRAPLTLVRAPAGAGKTTLTARWAAEEGARTPVAWLSLDPYDDDPAEFWADAVQALDRAGVLRDHPLPTPFEGTPTWFVPELAGRLAALDRPAVLVLDDADVLSAPAVTTGLDLLVRTAGRGLRLVLCSRAEPQLPVHRYRLAGSVSLIDAGRIRFTADETRELLAALAVLVDQEAAEALRAETQGWAAGIRLAAPIARATPHPATSLAQDDGEIARYLSAEVLDPLPAELRRFLLHAAVPGDLWPELVADLTGTPCPGRVLGALARANAFVEEAPDAPGGYRLHPLLRETLLGRLSAERHGAVAPLHRRCARWYADHGYVAEAVDHALAAEDRDLVAQLLLDELSAPRWLARGTDALWRRADRPLADGRGSDAAVLRAAAAVADGRDPAPEDLAAAARASEEGDRLRLRASAALTCLTDATRRGDLAAATTDASAVDPLIEALPPEERREAMAVLRVDVAVGALRSDEPADRLRADLRTAAAAAREAGAGAVRGLAVADLAVLEALDGDLTQALRSAAESDELAVEDGAGPRPLRSAAATATGWALLQRFSLAEAADWSARAGRRPGAESASTAPALAVLTSRSHRLHREYDEAIGRLEPWLHDRALPGWAREHVVGEAVRLAIARHEPSTAAALLDEVGDLGWRDRLLARVALVAGDPGAEAPAEPEAGAGLAVQVESLLLRGAWLLTVGREAAGIETLLAALGRARSELLRLPFLDAPPQVRRALRTVPALREDTRWLNPTARVHAEAAPPQRPAAPAVIEPLSAREAEVLQHLAELLSTEEIAATMFVSVNTVRTHIRSILRKLGVARRNDAVRRARELDLL